MDNYKIIEKPWGIVGFSLLIGFLVIAIIGVGCVPKSFHVSNVSLKAADFVPPADYTYKVVVTILFNRTVDQTSFKAPGTVNIDLKGLSHGNTAFDISGTFRFDPMDSRRVVFISNQTLSDLINPQAGENVEYTITIVGTDVGAGVVTDSSGEALDGDLDEKPGGNFTKVMEVVG